MDEHPDHNNDDWLKLSLATNVNSNPTPPPLPPSPSSLPSTLLSRLFIPNPQFLQNQENRIYSTPRTTVTTRSRRSNSSSSSNSNSNNDSQTADQPIGETIDPPFPWATDRPAGIHPLANLISSGLLTVEGEVVCRTCNNKESITYDLCAKFEEVGGYILAQGQAMHDRAPDEWLNPTFSECAVCRQSGSVRPLLADRNEKINWLFLFLGQMLGICTLEQLKWFCKHTKSHRTGAKNRVLYSSYIAICRLLQPGGVFECFVCKTKMSEVQ